MLVKAQKIGLHEIQVLTQRMSWKKLKNPPFGVMSMSPTILSLKYRDYTKILNRPEQGYPSARGEKENFKAALEKYLASDKSSRKRHVLKNMTLERLLETAKAAESKYKKSGVIRRSMRKFSKHAPALKAWLSLLPAVFPHSAIAYAGIKIMFDLAGKMHEGSGEVFKILGEIPDVIARAEVFVAIYQASPRVQEKSEELYLALLDVFEHSLTWLFKNPASM